MDPKSAVGGPKLISRTGLSSPLSSMSASAKTTYMNQSSRAVGRLVNEQVTVKCRLLDNMLRRGSAFVVVVH